jgi:transcriptional regulator with XRE-family HTH domain
MSTFRELWRKLSDSRDYRKEFVSTLLKRGTAMQIQSLMKQKGWTQTQLAEQSGLTQGVISRASNPAYGNLTFNTVIDIAGGFDVAFIGRFVPFSELAKYVKNMPEELSFSMPSFEHDRAPLDELDRIVNANNAPYMTAPEKPKSAANVFFSAQLEKKKPKSDDENVNNRFIPRQEGALANAASVGRSG